MNVLIACEFSGIVRNAFLNKGINAVSCDLLDCEQPGPHIKGDVHEYLQESRWDLIIAFPPCTRLCRSGLRWLYERDLWLDLNISAAFFRSILNAKAKHIAVENPTPHRHAVKLIGRKYDFAIHPYHFGHPESKRTCFWTKNLPDLEPTCIIPPEERSNRLHNIGPKKDRWKDRSRTFPGIAAAMADQWGRWVKYELEIEEIRRI